MHEVVVSHLFLAGSVLQVGQVARASSGLAGCARVKGRRARRTRELEMDFIFEDCLGFEFGGGWFCRIDEW